MDIVKGSGPIELTNNITLPTNANAGNYEVLLTLRDKFAGVELKYTKIFYVKRTEAAPAEPAQPTIPPPPAEPPVPAPTEPPE